MALQDRLAQGEKLGERSGATAKIMAASKPPAP